MDKPIFEKGKKYISASSAGKIFGYTTDYIGQLCRSKKVDGIMIGHFWFVSESGLIEHKKNRKLRNLRRQASVTKKDKFITTRKSSSQSVGISNEGSLDSSKDFKADAKKIPLKNPEVLEAVDEDSFSVNLPVSNYSYIPLHKTRIRQNAPLIYHFENDINLFPAIDKKSHLDSVQQDDDLLSKTTKQDVGIFSIRMFRNTAGISLVAILLLLFVWSKNEENLIDAKFTLNLSAISQNFDSGKVSQNIKLFGDRVSDRASLVAGVFLGAEPKEQARLSTERSGFMENVKRNIFSWNNKIRMVVVKLMFGNNVALNVSEFSAEEFFGLDRKSEYLESAERDSQNYPNGMVVLPYAEDERVRQTLTNNIQSSFSDEVEIKVDEDGVSGTITPVFREKRGEDYMYVLVPVKEKE